MERVPRAARSGWNLTLSTRLNIPAHVRLPRSIQHRRPLSFLSKLGASERGAVLAIIGFATVSALLWALIRTPGSGGPDEASHLALVESIREAGGIPIFEGFKPDDFVGSSGRVINAYELTPNLSALVLAGLASTAGVSDLLALTLLGRLYAVILFPITLLLAYLTLGILIPNRPVERLWALTALATLPQLMLVHSYVTNDTPTIAFASLAIYLTVLGWRRGFRRSEAIPLGIALGLVGLHKVNGLIVAPMAAGLIVWKLRHERIHLFKALGTVAVTALAVAGWWYARMLVIYGDPIGAETTRAAIEAVDAAVQTPHDQGMSLWEYARRSGWLQGTFRSFWAGYGVRRMTVPDAAYLALLVTLVVAAVGLIAASWGARDRVTGAGSVWFAFGLAVAGLWVLNLWTSWALDGAAMHGRYTYPVIVPFAALLVVGLSRALAVTGRSQLLLALTIPFMVVGNLTYFLSVVVPDVVALRA